jgi:hypothetical protein
VLKDLERLQSGLSRLNPLPINAIFKSQSSVSKLRGKTNLGQKSKGAADHVFIFLEIFECEGGIQSYVKDILQAYLSLTPQTGTSTTLRCFCSGMVRDAKIPLTSTHSNFIT